MTNVYALQKNVVFKPTDVMEMRQLFGLHLYMGCDKLPRLKMYWSLAMDLDSGHSKTRGGGTFFKTFLHFFLISNLL
jgi:hypothetical protein